MPDILASIGLAQAEKLQLFIDSKRRITKKYQDFFKGIGIESFREPANCVSNYWLNSIILKNREERDEFINFSNEMGINTRPVWPLIPEVPFYSRFQRDDMTNAGYLRDCIVNLPSSYSENTGQTI